MIATHAKPCRCCAVSMVNRGERHIRAQELKPGKVEQVGVVHFELEPFAQEDLHKGVHREDVEARVAAVVAAADGFFDKPYRLFPK